MRALVAILVLSLMTGCATGTGAKWYAVNTWFSHAPASAVDRADAKVYVAREGAIKAAQQAVHETQYALLSAPASRPVNVATASNDTAVGLLDQVAGPLPLAEATALREQVAGLLSDNAEIRAKAEGQRADQQKVVSTLSAKLETAVRQSETANDRLRVAFDRENALANQLRSQRALLWIAGGVAVLFAAGWVYLRFFLGGMPSAVGSLLAKAKDSHMTGDDIREHFDTIFHDKPSVLASVAAHYAKHQ